jgi:DNA repair exonuclease SbcCD ATPase subunit
MGTSRHRKNHKQKLKAYKSRMGQTKNKMTKLYQEAMKRQLEQMIAQRKAEENGETSENTQTNFVEDLKVDTLDNPYIQVVWEDIPENFTQERIKSVKQYFGKKYNSTNVNVITRVKSSDKDDLQTVDVSINISDKNYQASLIKTLLKQKGNEEEYEKVMKIDSMVENKLLATQEDVTAFKQWYIKKIEFSNFLSYGENQVLDFTKCNGITVVESDPPNFGGKTVLTVDLLMFLFFNTTTKTSKAEEVFNRFSDKNKVSVRGEITIDGEDYLIVRNLERKLSKAGDWNVKTELDFFKLLPNGEIQNFTGEQRRETEKFIKTSIGEQDDFLMTILTTASNLEDLLESKPTARGQVLSRFLGLELLKRKEELGKEIYSEFSKSMLSNLYSSEKLKQDIDNYQEKIQSMTERNLQIDVEIDAVKERIQKGQEYRDGLISKKHTNIDPEIARINPTRLEQEIQDYRGKELQYKQQIESIKVVEPKEFYHEDKHDEIKEQISTTNKQKAIVDIKIDGLVQLSKTVSGGMKCEHCGIDLMNAAITAAKLAEMDSLTNESKKFDEELVELNIKEKSFVQLKKDFDEYEKNKLIKEKYEANLESAQLNIKSLTEKLEKYHDVQAKIEENRKIEDTLHKATTRLDELNRENTQLEKEKGQNNVQIKNFQENITKNQSYIQTILEEHEKEKVYKLYLDVFGKNGITKSIMKQMVPMINQELQKLTQDSSYFKLEVRISDKNEVEFWMIDNGTGVEKLMVSGSGYERSIASLALRAVLSKICSLPKPNVIVFDEVFGKVSNENLEMVGEFFSKIKEYFPKIFVITHNPLVSNWADSIVKIKKETNISRVIQ